MSGHSDSLVHSALQTAFDLAWLSAMQGYDIMEEMYNQKTSAITFVQELCKLRSKACLHTVMGLASQVLQVYQVRLNVSSKSKCPAVSVKPTIKLCCCWEFETLNNSRACLHGGAMKS